MPRCARCWAHLTPRTGGGGCAEEPAARLWPRATIDTAALPAVLARRDLRRPPAPAAGPRGLGDKLAVLAAYVMARV